MKWSIHNHPKSKLTAVISLAIAIFATSPSLTAQKPQPAAWWNMDKLANQQAIDQVSKQADRIDGNFTKVGGARGEAIRFDSFTTEITRPAASAPKLADGFAIEGHVAFGAYPWNWCALVTQRDEKIAGFSVDIGTNGELRMQLKVGDEWKVCTAPEQSIPLWEWKHIVASYDPATGIALYIDGKKVSELACKGSPTFAPKTDLKIGTNHTLGKPSNIHRDHGTLTQFFSLDGIIDELKVYNSPLNAESVASDHAAMATTVKPDLPSRRLPSGPAGPGRFGAYYDNLKYYPEWDALWPVASDPDIIVRFDTSPARVVFWRGTRYSPAWVSGNDLWMADQSVEAWNNKQGCFEHMQDRRCRYSHVRIIESNPARVVVHWRYAPTSAHNELWRENPKTGRACWVDEYYTIYPDVAGVRNVSWDVGTLGKPQQFQESLPLTHPGQYPIDAINPTWVSLANYQGETGELRYEENPPKTQRKDIPKDLTVQRYNLKSKQKPFICFEPGNKMDYLKDRHISTLHKPGSCNHWPVGQAVCDGRSSQAADRPTHYAGFPISNPPHHQVGKRFHWYGLYGMTENNMDHLVRLGRSWSTPAPLKLQGDLLKGGTYDRGQRAYLLERIKDGAAELMLSGSTDTPVINPAFVIRNWGESTPQITLNGSSLKLGPDCRVGHRRHLNGTDLILWLKFDSEAPINIKLSQP